MKFGIIACCLLLCGIVGCSSKNDGQPTYVSIPVPMQCDYNLTKVDINTSSENETLRSSVEIILWYEKMQEDLGNLPCINLLGEQK